ncbi:MAG: pantoate--beta-alanine ligase [Gammaproteobacteria bacterium]|jgi:pantoate--beta-alanine ligase
MHIVHEPGQLRAVLAGLRREEGRIALVPTMGNLHAGHLALVRRARELASRVVVSIFVNPLQFDRAEDLAAYPRTPEADCRLLEELGVDVVFMPTPEKLYPHGEAASTRVEVPVLGEILEGASRPGHFTGVATIVTKLFNLVLPDLAVFGSKDFQQLQLIRRMVQDLDMDVEVIGVDTVREPDGLAMSSRNGYLSEAERVEAPGLYRSLVWVKAALESGETDLARLCDQAAQRLAQAGFRSDYVTIRRAADLRPAGEADRELVVLAAAWLGRARLIDNLQVTLPPPR